MRAEARTEVALPRKPREAEAMKDPSTQELLTLVRRHAPEILRIEISESERWAVMLGGGAVGALVGTVIGGLIGPDAVLPLVGASTVVAPFVALLAVHAKEMPLPSRVEVYAALGAAFRRQIEHRRAELLGPKSEVGKARQALVDALQEASHSRAYWTERSRQKDSMELVEKELPVATALVSKFETALARLDRRQSVLRDFLNDCEARISALENVGRDYEEVQRLRSLANRADEVVAEADESVGRIAAGFLREAQRVAEALGAVEMEQLKDVAAEVPLDRIEEVADQILEHSAREDQELQSLVDRLSATALPDGTD